MRPEDRGGGGVWGLGEGAADDAGKRLGHRSLLRRRRADEDLHPLGRSGEADIERGDRLTDYRGARRRTHPLPFGGEERLILPRDMDEDPADRLEGAGAIDDDARGAGDESAIEVGEDNQIEFQPLRLVDRHHADRRRDRIGDVDGPAVVDEGGGPHQSRARTAPRHVPFPGRRHELLEAAQIAVRACRADRRGEARKHRAIAIVDERSPEPIERGDAGGGDLPRGAGRVEAEERRERGGGDMEAGRRVGGMVDEVEGREEELDGR